MEKKIWKWMQKEINESSMFQNDSIQSEENINEYK